MNRRFFVRHFERLKGLKVVTRIENELHEFD